MLEAERRRWGRGGSQEAAAQAKHCENQWCSLQPVSFTRPSPSLSLKQRQRKDPQTPPLKPSNPPPRCSERLPVRSAALPASPAAPSALSVHVANLVSSWSCAAALLVLLSLCPPWGLLPTGPPPQTPPPLQPQPKAPAVGTPAGCLTATPPHFSPLCPFFRMKKTKGGTDFPPRVGVLFGGWGGAFWGSFLVCDSVHFGSKELSSGWGGNQGGLDASPPCRLYFKGEGGGFTSGGPTPNCWGVLRPSGGPCTPWRDSCAHLGVQHSIGGGSHTPWGGGGLYPSGSRHAPWTGSHSPL